MTETILDHLRVEIEKLPDLDDGDILFVKGPEHMTMQDREDLSQALRYALRGQGRSNTCVIVPGNFETVKANDAILAQLGLQRLPARPGFTNEEMRRLGVEPLMSDVLVESSA
jgi:hypothetical protein